MRFETLEGCTAGLKRKKKKMEKEIEKKTHERLTDSSAAVVDGSTLNCSVNVVVFKSSPAEFSQEPQSMRMDALGVNSRSVHRGKFLIFLKMITK